jgi:hypothetical protein
MSWGKLAIYSTGQGNSAMNCLFAIDFGDK